MRYAPPSECECTVGKTHAMLFGSLGVAAAIGFSGSIKFIDFLFEKIDK